MVRRIYDPRQALSTRDLAEKRPVVADYPVGAQAHDRRVDGDEGIGHGGHGPLALDRLLPTQEECERLQDPVAPAALMQAIEQLLGKEPSFAALMPGNSSRHDLMRIFMALPLSPALAYKLTVARDQRAEILDHSLRVAYCAAALAEHCRMAHHEIVNAAAAGLFHDLGLLHVDPALLKYTRLLGEHERHYLYSHPLTAYLILEHSPIWHPTVSTAVLEHHERIDGSGYPKGLTGDKLGQLGQLLAVAELAATLLGHGAGYSSRDRLGIVLRMNEGKLNHEYCSHLLAMFPATAAWGSRARSPGAAIEVLIGLSVAFLRWQEIAVRAPHAPLAGFIDKRMAQLSHSLAEVGIDLDYWSEFSIGADQDAASLGEMEVAAREGIWQLHAIGNEARRRWEHLAEGSEAIVDAAASWLDSVDNIRLA